MGVRDLVEAASILPIPVVSDVAAGGLALSDALRGDYKSAALNAAGMIPMVPAMGGVTRISSRFLKPQTADEVAQGFANRFVHPVHDNAGNRFSGFTDPRAQTTLHGYDKNGERFTRKIADLSPEELVSSRDGDRTLNAMLEALRNK